jgi:hypothetical protein
MALRAGEQRDRTIVSNKGAQRHAVTVDHDFDSAMSISIANRADIPQLAQHIAGC